MMSKSHSIVWRAILLALAFFAVGAVSSRAAIVSMDIYVTIPIEDGGGNNLVDGSVIYIFGSGDNINDGPVSFGTNLIADSTQGDDELIAVTRIGEGVLPGSGTFFVTILFDNTKFTNVYIRFFDRTNIPITGMVAWGTSAVFLAGGVTLGVATVELGTNVVSATNNFVVIPEPSTANLFVLVAGMMWAMRAHMKRNRNTPAPDS